MVVPLGHSVLFINKRGLWCNTNTRISIITTNQSEVSWLLIVYTMLSIVLSPGRLRVFKILNFSLTFTWLQVCFRNSS